MKPWNVVVDGRQYEIKARGGSLVVNGEKNKLKNLMSKKDGMWKIYELPLGPKKAEYYVNTWIGGTKLVMDGVDCATGKPFTATRLPKWAYIFYVGFVALGALGGAVGWLAAVVGILSTTGVSCNEKFSVPVRILLDLVILIACWAVVFGIAIVLSGLIYS